ncbi:MAG: hypothetical protein ACRDPE_19695 [Solirubrobacterales bacterium]
MARRRKGIGDLAKKPGPAKFQRCKATGKRRYSNRPAAVMAMASFSREETFKGQRVYRCPHCGGFHTTSRLK